MNFIQQAYKGYNKWYHYLATFFLVLFGWQIIGILPLSGVAVMYSKNMSEFSKAASNNFMSLGINKNLFLFLMILMFVFGLLFLFLGIRYIHKRSVTSLVTSREEIDWKRFWTGFISWGIIACLVTVSGLLLSPEEYTWNFKPIPFFTLLAVSFLFLPLQTSFEELLFRGYFMQGIGISTKNRYFPMIFIFLLIIIIGGGILVNYYSFSMVLFIFTILSVIVFLLMYFGKLDKLLDFKVYDLLFKLLNRFATPLLVTSIIFGLLHAANPEVEKLGYISMVFYIGTGLFYGITTLLDEGTELAMGMHAINNITAAFLVTTNWTVFQTDALYIDTSEPSVSWEMFFPVFVLYPLMLLFFSKKYGWKNWKGKLLGKIEKPVLPESQI